MTPLRPPRIRILIAVDRKISHDIHISVTFVIYYQKRIRAMSIVIVRMTETDVTCAASTHPERDLSGITAQ